jgi:hypothetical protein
VAAQQPVVVEQGDPAVMGELDAEAQHDVA